VVTAAVEGRLELLARALESVRRQTLRPVDHLVALDYARRGTGATLAKLARAVDTEWIATLDDDDELLPHHLETLHAHREGADVVYPYCRVVGRRPLHYVNRPFDPELLRRRNFIPATALIRTATLRAAGGWPDHRLQDYRLWLRLLDHGARFQHVPEVTWIYHHHGANKSKGFTFPVD